MNRFIASSLVALSALAMSSSAHAVTHTWNGGNAFGPDSMSNPLNWSGGVPVSGNANLTLIFPNGASSFQPNQNIVAGPLVLQSMQVNSFYNFTGNGYEFKNLGAAPTLIANASAVFNTPLKITDATAATIPNGLTINGLFSGGGDLSLSSAFSTSFSIGGASANTYSGTLKVNANVNGTFAQTGGPAIQGDLEIDGSNATVTTNVPNQFGPNSDVLVTNGGFLQMFFTTPQTVRDITANNFGVVSPNNALLTVTGSISSSSGVGFIANNSGDVVNLNGNFTNVNVTSTGPGELLQSGYALNSTIVYR